MPVARADQAFAAVELTCEADELKLTADPAKSRQVLWNLLRNASDAAAGTRWLLLKGMTSTYAERV